MIRSDIEAAGRATAEDKLAGLSIIHAQFRDKAAYRQFECTDPTAEATALAQGATLLVGFATELRNGHVRDIPDGLLSEVAALATQARGAMRGQSREVTVETSSGPLTRRLELPNDPGTLVEILTPRISEMGLSAHTIYERGELFMLLRAKHFPQTEQ